MLKRAETLHECWYTVLYVILGHSSNQMGFYYFLRKNLERKYYYFKQKCYSVSIEGCLAKILDLCSSLKSSKYMAKFRVIDESSVKFVHNSWDIWQNKNLKLWSKCICFSFSYWHYFRVCTYIDLSTHLSREKQLCAAKAREHINTVYGECALIPKMLNTAKQWGTEHAHSSHRTWTHLKKKNHTVVCIATKDLDRLKRIWNV